MRLTRRLSKRYNRPSRTVGKARKAKLTRRYRGGVHYTQEELNNLKKEIQELMNNEEFLQQSKLEDLSNYLDDQSVANVNQLFEITAHKILDCDDANITSKADVNSHVQQYLTRFYNGHVNSNNTKKFSEELNDLKKIKYDCVDEFSENLTFVPGNAEPLGSPQNRTRKSTTTKPERKIILVREQKLPAGWNSEIDKVSNHPYYWDNSDPTNTTTWIHPTNKSPRKSFPGQKSPEKKNKSPKKKTASPKRNSPAAAPAATLPPPSLLEQITNGRKLQTRVHSVKKSPPKLSNQEILMLGNNPIGNLRKTIYLPGSPKKPQAAVNQTSKTNNPHLVFNTAMLDKFGSPSKKDSSAEWSSVKSSPATVVVVKKKGPPVIKSRPSNNELLAALQKKN